MKALNKTLLKSAGMLCQSIVLIGLVSTLMFSCDEKEDITNDLENTTSKTNLFYEKSSNDEKAYALVRILGKAIENSNFRKLLKTKALEKFDNDYDILYQNLIKTDLPGTSISCQDFLVSCANVYGGTLSKPISFDTNDLKNLGTIYEHFQISIPVNCDEWDTYNYIPLITFIPEDYEESDYSFITVYDYNGNESIISLDITPVNPVIVLGSCERLNKEGQFKSQVFENSDGFSLSNGTIIDNVSFSFLAEPPIAPTLLNVNSGFANQLILEWNDNSSNEYGFVIQRSSSGSYGFTQIASTSANTNSFVDMNVLPANQYFYRVRAYNNIGSSSFTNVSQYIASPRSGGNFEKIEKMKFTDLKAYEKWISGAPEIRVRVAWGTTSSAGWVIDGDFVEPKKRKDIDNNWFIWNHSLSRWYPSENGKIWTIHFTEEDPGSGEKDVKFNTSFEQKTSNNTTIATGIEMSFKTGKKDDVITYKPVSWWHSLNDIYNNGKFQWKMNSSSVNN